MCAIVTGTHYETRLAAKKEEHQQLLQTLEQWRRMGRARDVQISQLRNENELVLDECKQKKLEVLYKMYQF